MSVQMSNLLDNLKARIKHAVAHAQRGLTRKEIAKALGMAPGSRDLDTALESLIQDSALIRAGGVGAGYRYWLGNA
jgi:hypothetical protein